ncbi:MAG: hypothetical protein DSY46_05980 [Hydrogenimonas sp.]|nr:MAG: hypothetical protein DSY46_05980 [Hydrogenimonas sp.]
MKIALKCRSLLLEKSLRIFLKGYIVPEDQAQMIVTDDHVTSDLPIFRIGLDEEADLVKPFSSSQLMIKLEEKFENYQSQEALQALTLDEEVSLEEKIEHVTRSFVQELTSIIREHYEKR